MKKSLFFTPLVAALALTSCSSDEPLAPNGNFDGTYDGEAYMRVRIAMPEDATRAEGFEYGTAEEQAIKSIGLKFYNADGSFYGYGNPVKNPNILQDNTDPNGPVEARVAEAVIVLKINNNAPKPTHVVAFVNCGDDWREGTGANELPIDQIGRTLDRITTVSEEDGKEFFAMSSANYRIYIGESGMNTFVQGYQRKLAASDFYTSEEDALESDHAVDIYVERLAAKVRVKEDPNLETTNNPEIENNGYKLKFVIDGYALGGLNSQSYLIKNLDSRWDDSVLWRTWNDESNHRCYWGKDMNYTNDFIPQLGYKSYNDAANNFASTAGGMYSHENTLTTFSGTISPDNLTQKPKLYEGEDTKAADNTLNRYLYQEFVYVMGHYEVTKEDGTPVTDEYLYENAGSIVTEDVLISFMESNLGDVIYTKTETGEGLPDIYTSVNMNSEGLLKLGSYQLQDGVDPEYDSSESKKDASLVCLYLSDKATKEELSKYYVLNPAFDETTNNTVDKYITATPENVPPLLKQTSIQAYGFKYDENVGGYLAYFPILIKHLNSGPGKSESDRGYYGVVRNHIYDITINSIKGLGIGIYDPTIDIIPKDKLKPLFLAATFNILSWKVVKQVEDLQQ